MHLTKALFPEVCQHPYSNRSGSIAVPKHAISNYNGKRNSVNALELSAGEHITSQPPASGNHDRYITPINQLTRLTQHLDDRQTVS
jgi:hypothetical protein